MTKVMSISSYFGGKNGEIGEWIANQLPYDPGGSYCEPFAGLLGVLLRRRPCKVEIVNDLNQDIVDLWRGVRDHPDELKHLFSCTPRSRELYLEAAALLAMQRNKVPLVKRAWAVATVCHYSRQHSTTVKQSNYAPGYIETRALTQKADYLDSLKHRLKMVQLENTDALKLIDRISDYPEYVIYIDPPYPKADHHTNYGYMHDDGKLIEILRSVKGKIAISGYADQYDSLGWQRSELITATGTGNQSERTEVLWCNFEPENHVTQPELDL